MNKYETVVIMDSKITDEERNEAINRIYTYISENGEIISKEEMGKKKLAYEVKKQKEAFKKDYTIQKRFEGSNEKRNL